MKKIDKLNYKNGANVKRVEIEREISNMESKMKKLKVEDSFFNCWSTGNTIVIGYKFANDTFSQIIVSKDYTEHTYQIENQP